ncbi:hypothetical protein RJT34_15705 [Clitoria ternatea]|uniref:Uncharacterized protein n=1 Tax=Clitoria ternatea TaxID=43366 RepID=A0AAN9PC82_CLITE
MGKSTLGLSYGLTFSEVLIALAMPSITARVGGVFLPNEHKFAFPLLLLLLYEVGLMKEVVVMDGFGGEEGRFLLCPQDICRNA